MTTLVGPSPYLKDFFLFQGREVFDFLGLGVSDLFEFVERALLVVLADFLFLLEFLDGLFNVAAHAANRGAMIFEHLVNVLREILAAIFGERRDRNANDFAVVRGIQAEIGHANRPVNQRN